MADGVNQAHACLLPLQPAARLVPNSLCVSVVEGFRGPVLQALETERGGIQIYTAAIQAAQNEDLRKEWQEYLEETRTHEKVLLGVFEQLGLDPEARSPGRDVVAHQGQSLVMAIEMAGNCT